MTIDVSLPPSSCPSLHAASRTIYPFTNTSLCHDFPLLTIYEFDGSYPDAEDERWGEQLQGPGKTDQGENMVV